MRVNAKTLARSGIPTRALSPIDDNSQMDARAIEVLDFWFGLPRERWFRKDAEFDRVIRNRFLARHEEARAAAKHALAWSYDRAMAPAERMFL